MSSNPSLPLPQIPKGLDKDLGDFLNALVKTMKSKHLEDYNDIQKINDKLSNLDKTIQDHIG